MLIKPSLPLLNKMNNFSGVSQLRGKVDNGQNATEEVDIATV